MEDKLKLHYNKHFESVIANIKAGNDYINAGVINIKNIKHEFISKALSGYKEI